MAFTRDLQAAWVVRIAIDASRCTVPRVTGTENYAIQLIRALIALNTEHHITLYFRDPPKPDLFPASPLVTTRIIPFRRAWTHLRFAAALWQDRPDVTFVPAHTLPFAFPGRAVVTVHDLGFKYFPEAHPLRQRFYLDWTTRYSARRASAVLADSQATANDLTRFYGTPSAKIHVVYPAVEPPISSNQPTPNPDSSAHTSYLIPHYFLFIGTLQPRKNIARIVAAYKLWKIAHPGDPTQLVLAGGKGWLYDPAWTEGVDGVVLPGYISNAEKADLLSNAVALVFPTLYEGFGFPIIEAMHAGTPVIGSTTSSLPELIADSGLIVNPLDTQTIANAMSRITDEPDLRVKLIEKGYQQAKKFTWQQAAQQALTALELAAK